MSGPAGSLRLLLRDLVHFARWRLAAVAGLSVAAAAAEGAGLLLLVPLLQFVGVGGSGAGLPLPTLTLEQVLPLYVTVVAAAALVVAVRAHAVAALRGDYTDALRRRLHRALMGMEFAAFSRLRAADLQQATIMETMRSAQGVDFVLRLSGLAVEIAVLLAVAVKLSPPLTAAALALAGACVVLTRPLSRRASALGRRQVQAGRELQAELSDDLAGMRVIRGLGVEEPRHRRFAQCTATVHATQLAYQRLAGLARAATQTLAAAAAAAAIWLAVRVLELPLADTLVLLATFARLLTAALRLQDSWRTVLNTLPAHASVHALESACRAAAEPPPQSGAARLPLPFTRLDLHGIGFTHDGAAAALDGIDLCIPGHAVTAVIGPSGAGKSTLADVLLGLLSPDRGCILVDGLPLRGALRRAWRTRVGYVPQDAFLFHDTIRANLTLAAPDASEAALWTALERAAAADFVRALPQGLDTIVGDRGNHLSGGERQRLALARVLLTDCALLILDEATSALDSESEQHVMTALAALRGEMALVVIAHRPSTVRAADHVAVLENGRLAAAGSWPQVRAAAAPLLERLTMAHC